jgi:hypothetical protein
MLKDQESLDQFLAGIMRCALELLVDSRQVAGDQADGEDQLFKRVLSEMDGEDARCFREAMREGLFSENIFLFDKAFVIDWREADIFDIRVLKEAGLRQ